MKSVALVALLSVALTMPASAAEKLKWSGCDITKKAFMAELAAAFEKETGVKIELSGGGATKGIRNTDDGSMDLGGTCRHLVVEAEEDDVKLWPVAWDAIVPIVHRSNPIEDISHTDLKRVFTGQITNWKEVGAKESAPLLAYERKSKISGVGMVARELLFGDMDTDFKLAKDFPSTGPLEKAIEETKEAITLTGISSARKRNVKILKVNGVEPTVENIASGKYILHRPLYIVTKKSPSKLAMRFVNFARSERGQAIIASQGTVTLKGGGGLWGPYRAHMNQVTGQKKGVFE